ncbi:hypothetical protein GCM10009559_63420 [Pseudonocardia zijingensis]|uniref:Uncharacterized protein n=1 Tax=Pseudonocardia zijingensis TaxID=153376 RepID=A0ABP3YQ30_9PSEU
MPMWLRITLLLAVLGWSIYAAIRRERTVQRRLVREARGSVGRALAVISGYYLALVAVVALSGLGGALAHRAGLPTLTILLLVAGLAVTAPFLWVFAPSGEHGGAATPFRDLRRLGARAGVARALAYPAIAYHFLLLVPAQSAAAIAVIVVE